MRDCATPLRLTAVIEKPSTDSFVHIIRVYAQLQECGHFTLIQVQRKCYDMNSTVSKLILQRNVIKVVVC